MSRRVLHTKLCDLLEIEYPIVQAGMAREAGPTLTAAVSNAGGLGILGGAGVSSDQLAQWIRETKRLTSKPFGVNLLLPAAGFNIRPLEELKDDYDKATAFVQSLMKELNLTESKQGMDLWANMSEEYMKKEVEVVLGEHVPVLMSGLGMPDWLPPLAHENEVKVMSLVGNTRQARYLANLGVDIIVAQGTEAGGHASKIGALALIPQAVDAVSPTPVIAAGGVADGRGLAACLTLGAQGVMCGTAFVATHEFGVDYEESSGFPSSREFHDYWKQNVIKASDSDPKITRIFSGKTARGFPNELTRRWEEEGIPIIVMPYQSALVSKLDTAAVLAGKYEYACTLAGNIAGLIKEVKNASQVIEEMVDGAINVLSNVVPSHVKLSK